jgi:hypothetical protein
MKDYNSIPFKNKDIDRLTRNTTIITDSMIARPDTKFKEVTVKPSSQQVSDYTTNADIETDAINADTKARLYVMQGGTGKPRGDKYDFEMVRGFGYEEDRNRGRKDGKGKKYNTLISSARAELEAAKKENARVRGNK